MCRILRNRDFIWRDYFENHDGSCIIRGDMMEYANEFLTRQNVFMGAYVLSYSRLMLDKAINAFLPNKINGQHRDRLETIFKGDTDSITISKAMVNDSNRKLIQLKAGYLTDEMGEDAGDNMWKKNPKKLMTNIYEYVSPASKIYSDKAVVIGDDGTRVHMVKDKSKGISKISRLYHERITRQPFIETLKDLVLNGKSPTYYKRDSFKKVCTRVSKEQYADKVELFNILQLDTTRKIGVTEYKARNFTNKWYKDKRCEMYGWSYPHGYISSKEKTQKRMKA